MASPDRHFRFEQKASLPISVAKNRFAETALGHVEDLDPTSLQM
jgi:hypothetical protein